MVIISRKEKVEVVVVLEGGREQDKNRGRKPGLIYLWQCHFKDGLLDLAVFPEAALCSLADRRMVGWSALDAVP